MFANINEFRYRTGVQAKPVAGRWQSLIQRQPGFLGFLALDKGDDETVIITLWESREAASGWSNNPEYQALRERELRPNVTNWSVTPAQVEGADLKNIVV